MTFSGTEASSGSYGPNQVVNIDGDLAGGCVDLLGQYSASVYVVPDGAFDNVGDPGPFGHVSFGGQPNAVINSDFTNGQFIDETIGITTPSGNLGTGNYEVVLDLCSDGFWNPPTDVVAADFTVSSPANVPALPLLNPMKAEAHLQAQKLTLTATSTAALFVLYDTVGAMLSVTGDPAMWLVNLYLDYVCTALPPDSNGLPVTPYCPTPSPADILRLQNTTLKQLLALVAHYQAIANDPPDSQLRVARHGRPDRNTRAEHLGPARSRGYRRR